ncbi:MAG: chromosome partitioning protein ParB, partial [Eubacteriales bacterium]|nr:chromosome partitioning protein ParB [Eubacteriales bacterium]
GHARAIAGIRDKERQQLIANRVVKEELSVRETESIANTTNAGAIEKCEKAKPRAKNRELKDMEESLKNILGTKVAINNGIRRGKIEIEYYSREELERLLELLLGIK